MSSRRGVAPVVVAAVLTGTLLTAGAFGRSGGSHRPVPPATHVTGSQVVANHDIPRTTPPLAGLLHCPVSARACVDTVHERAWLQQHGDVVYGPVRVGLGRPGHRTPQGTFRVAYKAEQWTSTEYGLPMPWAVFFATGGIAFHAGPLGVRSHGCVHLRPRAATRFFDYLQAGDKVVVR